MRGGGEHRLLRLKRDNSRNRNYKFYSDKYKRIVKKQTDKNKQKYYKYFLWKGDIQTIFHIKLVHIK